MSVNVWQAYTAVFNFNVEWVPFTSPQGFSHPTCAFSYFIEYFFSFSLFYYIKQIKELKLKIQKQSTHNCPLVLQSGGCLLTDNLWPSADSIQTATRQQS